MGSCISTKNTRPSSSKKTRSKKKSTLSKSPSFIYIPQDDRVPARHMSGDNYTQTWSNILKKKKLSFSCETDFSQIYKKSEVVDKKLFLSTGFIAEDLYSPTPSLLTPITPAYNVINSTFPRSLLSPDTPSPHFGSAYHAACYNTTRVKKPNNRRRPDSSANSTGRQPATTLESQATTYISEDRTEPIFFDFDEEAVKGVHRFYASSLKTEVIGMF